MFTVVDAPPECLSPLRPDIVTVGFPGFMASRAQMAKYCGPEGVVVLDRATREPLFHSRCAVAPRILHNCLPLPEVGEIEYGGITLYPHHWLLMLRSVAVRHLFRLDVLPPSYMRLDRVNLGGWRDQQDCTDDIARAVQLLEAEGEDAKHEEEEEDVAEDARADKQRPELKEDVAADGGASSPTLDQRASSGEGPKASQGSLGCCGRAGARPARVERIGTSSGGRRRRLVLFGCSRGATTTLYAALRLPPHVASAVSLVIVEAPFDTMKNVFDESMWFPRLGMAAMQLFGKYDGEAPYDVPETTHLTCPIAFITAKNDTRVPPQLTLRLMNQVRQRHPQLPVHHLELQHSTHANMSIGHPEDQAAYVRFVDDLYDRYVT